MRQFRRDPREEDGRKLENLRTSLVPLLAQLTRLQVASGVYECAQSQTTHRNYSLEEWDILDETPDQERPDGEAVRGHLMQWRVTKRQVEKGAHNPKFIEKLGA